MEERQVTVDGTTYLLQAPFMVIATQNPVEMEGTYPLPEAQRDRFTARISLGYPLPAAEREMLDTHGSSSPLDQLKPVARASDVQELVIAGDRRVARVRPGRKDYIINLANATPGRRPSCASARHPGPPCTCCGPAGPGPRSTGGTT